MILNRIVLCLMVLGFASIGCSRKHTRPDPLERQPPMFSNSTMPSESPPAQFANPSPPAPPPLPTPQVSPPRSDELAMGSPPPMPGPGAVVPAESVPSAVEPPPSIVPPPAPNPIAVPPQPAPQATVAVPPTAPEPVPAKPAIVPVAAATPAIPGPKTEAAAVRKLLDQSLAKWNTVTDYEARFVKREVVNGKKLPQDQIAYRFRKQPLSVGMKVLSEAGQGREVIYVQGRDSEMHVMTGKGDNLIVGVGYKTKVSPDSAQATAKSRYKIYEAGFGRVLSGLSKAVALAEQGNPVVKHIGPQERPEYPYPLEAVEVSIRPGDDRLFPRGGRRVIYFDSRPDSPSHALPVLTVAFELTGTEVEYYCFDQIRLPAGLTDVDFDPTRMGTKK